jgi:hypothetical protein
MHKNSSLLPNKASEKSFLFFNNVVLQMGFMDLFYCITTKSFHILIVVAAQNRTLEAPQMMFNLFLYSTSSCFFLMCRKEPRSTMTSIPLLPHFIASRSRVLRYCKRLSKVGLKIISPTSLIIRDLSASCPSTSISNSFSASVIKRLVS